MARPARAHGGARRGAQWGAGPGGRGAQGAPGGDETDGIKSFKNLQYLRSDRLYTLRSQSTIV